MANASLRAYTREPADMTVAPVLGPPRVGCEQLDAGYAWCYEKLFSHRSIWRRRPADTRAVLAYLAMSYLYKRSNRCWHLLIKHRLTGAVWHPLIEHSRRRHLKLRPRLAALEPAVRASHCVSPGV